MEGDGRRWKLLEGEWKLLTCRIPSLVIAWRHAPHRRLVPSLAASYPCLIPAPAAPTRAFAAPNRLCGCGEKKSGLSFSAPADSSDGGREKAMEGDGRRWKA